MKLKYGIDFGTTNSSIGYRYPNGDELELEVVDLTSFYPRSTIPSLFYIDFDGSVLVGRDADRNSNDIIEVLYRNGDGELVHARNTSNPIRHIKMDLEKYGTGLTYRLNGIDFSVSELIGELFKVLREHAEDSANDNGISISDGVVLGVPVDYGDNQKGVLKEALVRAGFYETEEEADQKTEFVSEPVAVAVYYGMDIQKDDKNVLVFDFGGGTLDVAVVNLKNQVGTDHLHPHDVLAKKRLTLGGEEINRIFFENSFCAKYGIDVIGNSVGYPVNSAKQLTKYIFEDSQYRSDFISVIEKCKIDLSYSKNTTASFPALLKLPDKKFSRNDFEESIGVCLNDIQKLLIDVIEEAIIKAKKTGLDFESRTDIDYVLLAGGSSLIPCVQDCLGEFFPAGRIQACPISNKQRDSKEIKKIEVLTSVVRGLAIIACKEQEVELVSDVVDSDYGIWDSGRKRFSKILSRNTPKADTLIDKVMVSGISKTYLFEDPDAGWCDFKIMQRTVSGESTLGTIEIRNPGGHEYKVFMQVSPQKSLLEVFIYNVKTHDFIDIPLKESTFQI